MYLSYLFTVGEGAPHPRHSTRFLKLCSLHVPQSQSPSWKFEGPLSVTTPLAMSSNAFTSVATSGCLRSHASSNSSCSCGASRTSIRRGFLVYSVSLLSLSLENDARRFPALLEGAGSLRPTASSNPCRRAACPLLSSLAFGSERCPPMPYSSLTPPYALYLTCSRERRSLKPSSSPPRQSRDDARRVGSRPRVKSRGGR